MIKRKKNKALLALAFSFALAGCEYQESDSTPAAALSTEAPAKAATATQYVKLYYAKRFTKSDNPMTPVNITTTFTGYIELENVAYQKEVTVIYKTGDSLEWKSLPAKFLKMMPGNKEAWQFEQKTVTPVNNTPWTDISFAVQYKTAGAVYWDNNNGANYTILKYSRVVFGKSTIANEEENSHASNINGHKDFWGFFSTSLRPDSFGIVYTTDGWKSSVTTGVPVDYYDGEHHFIIKDFPDSASVIEYAVYYSLNGVKVFDNNFGRNFKISIIK